MGHALQEWANNIDIGGDGKKDGHEYKNLKDALVQDAERLWKSLQDKKIDRDEYDHHLAKLKEILEKHHISVQAAYDRFNQERKVVFLETENKASGLLRTFRNVRSKIEVERDQITAKDLLQGYTNAAGNYTIRVKDFEAKLKTDDFKTLNTREISSYMEYLFKNGKLNMATIEEKFGANMIGFMQVWSKKVQESYNIDKKARKSDDVTIGTQLGNVFFGHEKKVEKVLDEIFQTRIGQNNILSAKRIYEGAKTPEKGLETSQYKVFLEKAYKALGKWQNEKEFRKKFEDLLKNGFSSYDAVFEILGNDGQIKEFQSLMAEVEKMELKKAQETTSEIHAYVEKKPHLYGKNFLDLPSENMLSIAKREKDAPLLELLEEREKHKKSAERAGTTAKKESAAIVMMKGWINKSDRNKINRGIDVVTQVLHSENKMDSAENLAIIRGIPWFENLKNFSQISGDQKSIALVLSALRSNPRKNVTEVKLLTALDSYLDLKKNETKEVIKTVKNINDVQYEELKKAGKIQDSLFAEEILGPIASGTTVLWLQKNIEETIDRTAWRDRVNQLKPDTIPEKSLSRTSEFASASFISAIDSLKPGERSEAIKLGNENVYVKKSGSGFEVETKFQSIYCSDTGEVGNYLDSRTFIHAIGCGFMMGHMDKILLAIQAKNPENCERFDMRNGFSSKQRFEVMQTMIEWFGLPIAFEGISADELQGKFEGYFFTKTGDRSLRSEARQKWLIGDDGGFDARKMGWMILQSLA